MGEEVVVMDPMSSMYLCPLTLQPEEALRESFAALEWPLILPQTPEERVDS